MKKTLALVLALAMVFSTITVAFAEGTLGADAQVCSDLGMLKGETGTVDAAYVATAPSRLQAAIMFLRLKGLEAEALAFTGTANFADATQVTWDGGKAVMAYLKANPQYGWMGDGTNFNPNEKVTAQQYYKVMLEALGYKQTTAEVVGDFQYADVFTFAASVGLSKVATVASFTVNDLAIATVEALKLNVKDTTKSLAATLVEAGKMDKAKAVAAELIPGEAAAPVVAIDEAMAAGNAAVDVVYEDDVDAAAAGNIANYTIEGLEITAVTVTGSDSVRLDTAAMTSGKIYKLTVGEKTVQFTAVAKVSGGPEIKDTVSEDVEEVVITFTKNIDQATGTDVANYSIAGVTIVAAEIDPDDPDEVILTTEGLKNKTKYTVKVTNVKSVDGVSKKSDSDSFTVKYDLTAPKVSGSIEVQTNQRIVVNFTEKVDKASAEDLANYSIKVDETDGAALEIVSVTWDDDDENFVEITTEPMEKREDYELSISNIADQRKVPNVMTKTAKADFEGIAEDEQDPKFNALTVLSPTKILVEFTDNSKLDEESALDLNNYELEDLDIESIETLKNEWKVFRALLTVEEMETGESYDLTISDVLDEFGNALAETKKVAKANTTNFQAAKIVETVATGENTILVRFNTEIDEDTAENISNYEIDEEVGAPTEAKYAAVDRNKDGDKTDANELYIVTLTVNDLVNGYELAYYDNTIYVPSPAGVNFQVYDLTVDGVEDLAGNKLFYEVEVDTTTNKWDNSKPELEDVEVVDNKVIALAFDEAVYFDVTDNSQLVLWPNVTYKADGTVDTHGAAVTLTAKDYTDDFSVVEFSAKAPEAALTAGTKYTVAEIVYGSITDLAGNVIEAITVGDFEFEGAAVADNPEGPEVDSYEQTNAKTFEVTMTRWVDLVPAGVPAGWTVTVDEDVVTFEKTDLIKEDTDYTFDLRDFLVDKHGTAVQNADATATTYLTGEYTDEDAPYIEEVEAIDSNTIKITFNEDIKTGVLTTDFILENYDLDSAIAITGVSDDDGDKVIKLTTGKALESRYEYELTLKKGVVKDFANIVNEAAESFYFEGTNLQ